ncbi:MAG: LapD/MoxY N-terminal periplasmic domain-containing protein [Porticoccaceae bacterium]
MSLYRQLIGAISAVILLLVSLWIIVSIYTDKSTLIRQMQVQAQSGATSLAISMTEVLKKNDRSRLGVLFNAVSDLGYYQKIYFVDLENNRLIERAFSLETPRVPEFFIKAVDLPPIEARAAVSSGWSRIGDVVVVVSLRQSYEQLWQATLKKAIWSLSMSLAAILLITIIIKLRLRAAQRP